MERKINIEEILISNHFTTLNILKSVCSADTHNENMYERLMNGIKDVCRQTLELAAENAEFKLIDCGVFNYPKINEQSILDTIKQIE